MRKLNIKEIINNDYIFKKYITSHWICVKAAIIPLHGLVEGRYVAVINGQSLWTQHATTTTIVLV